MIINDRACELVRSSREEQGLPPTIRDPGTLARVAELIALAGPTRKDTAVTTAGYPVMEAQAARRRLAEAKGGQ